MSLPVPLITHPCSFCNNPTTLWCSNCHSEYYCCPDHLRFDWERHRHSCTPFVPSIPPQLDPSSTTTKYAAILFPCDSDTPRIVDVHCMSRQGPTGPCKWTPLVYKYIGGEREPASALVTRGVGGAALRFPLQVHYRADFLVDGSPPNRSIQRLTGGHSTHQWNGNVIALKFFGNRRQGYSDASNGDLAALVAYFMETPPRSD